MTKLSQGALARQRARDRSPRRRLHPVVRDGDPIHRGQRPQPFDILRLRSGQALRAGAALSTASAVARENGVDPATVVRMTQRLGYRGWPELRDELAAGIVEGTDVVAGTEPIPLLQGRREALEAQREALQRAVETLDAEIAWIDEAIEQCEAGE